MEKIIFMLNLALLSVNNAVGAEKTVAFSPYADITINTHWDAETQDMEPMDLTQIALDNNIRQYHLAFITDSGSCQPAWGAQATYGLENNWGKHLTDKLAQNGIDVTISFGGASGTDISLNCDKDKLNEIFEKVISAYQAKGLDFDIENGTADVNKLIQALQSFQQRHPKIRLSFTLPVLPEGLTFEGKEVLNTVKAAGLNYQVNIMAMDYGPAYAGDMGSYAIRASNALHDTLKELYPEKDDASLWQQIMVTPMIGVNDVNIEQFTLDNADALKQFADSKRLGALSMWSIARDKPCAEKWASPTCSGKNLQKSDYEFVQHFQKPASASDKTDKNSKTPK
ncbi:chitinase [Legionella jordanis]|uniref:Chitinase domain protein n=1 Tax=Legionella jordanis TaxID=456 RepID=A0A0W0VDP8_9GAMM|nr:chitinase [Legionella jordanis]KTD18238.1 chitinase domain protein [Legionella jordanis]RMX01195.1 chitinase [Legionella jordanis]RMX21425.1 chitinase [Legionella jordanis]VEH13669.1 chitinase domain protein [Legionella jordanis]